MTQMSESHYVPNAVSQANCATRQARSRLARPLHTSATVVPLFLLIFAGCVLPPTLGVEQQDAGINSPPAILSVRSVLAELTEPGPIDISKMTMGQTLTFRLLDTDLSDTLFVKVFVDYNAPPLGEATAPKAFCTAASDSKSAERTCTAQMDGVCLGVNTAVQHQMQIYVFDRVVLDSGTPLYMSMPPGGLSTNRTYLLNCT
jgi:hypothetical protein